jgi:hypothetical protein
MDDGINPDEIKDKVVEEIKEKVGDEIKEKVGDDKPAEAEKKSNSSMNESPRADDKQETPMESSSVSVKSEKPSEVEVEVENR